jgi:hypothetical protein
MLVLTGRIKTIERLDGGLYSVEVAGTHATAKAKQASKYAKGDWVCVRAEYDDKGLIVQTITATEPINESLKEK